MATREASDQLSRRQIVRLASAISADNMESIAEGYMDIGDETIKNIRRDASNSEAFNRDVIRHWMYKNSENQIKKLAALLYQAAAVSGYVDAKKVEDILRVSPRETPSMTSSTLTKINEITMEELLTLAGDLRPWTERAMKIEVAPWIREYVAEMDVLYCELILEKLHNLPTGLFRKRIENYAELFVLLEHEGDLRTSVSSRVPGKKILIKGDPGIGKTTLVKKIAWDWAKKLFKNVTIVFVVFLKLVKLGDSIESVIIDQRPELHGLGVTVEKLRSMLEHFGTKSLLILDGMDEHALGKNQDVLEIVRHKKYLFCNVILTSRPHSTRDIERYFDTIVSVEGFTRSEARKFALRIVPDENKVEDILRFNPTGLREKISLYNCPILLSFLCILVREDDVELSSRDIFTGEMYIRMVRCLYKKYCIRKGIEFEENKFEAVMTLIGHLALKALLSGNPLMKRSDVIREVGDDAFAYGLLIGHEDFRVIRDETADILITFAHRSIQEFLGSFYFIQKLTEGKSIKSLLGIDCSEPIFMVNPLFLHFCLWLLYRSEQYLSLPSKERVCETLKSFTRERINRPQLHISDIVRLYPAIDFERAVNEDDELSMKFFGGVLKGINEVKHLTLRTEDPLEWILAHARDSFANLTVLRLCSKTFTSTLHGVTFDGLYQEMLTMTLPQFTDMTDEHLNIVLTDEIYRSRMLEEVFKYCTFSKRRPAVYLYLQDGVETDLSNLLQEDLHKIHVLSTKPVKVTLQQAFNPCPHLSDLSLVGHLTLDKSVFAMLAKGVRSGNLPSLSQLILAGVTFVDVENSYRVLSQWSSLRYLNLFGCELSDSDIQVLSVLNLIKLVLSGVRTLKRSSHGVETNDGLTTSRKKGTKLLPKFLKNPLKSRKDRFLFGSKLSELSIFELSRSGFEELIDVLDQRQLCNLTMLYLSMAQQQLCCLADLKPHFIPHLKILRLKKCITSIHDLKHLSDIVSNWKLEFLDINHSSGISRSLSVLMKQRFPYLRTLLLIDCGLQSDDLSSLAKAKQEGRLPKLGYLDISHNTEDLDCLFSLECKWENLVYLNITTYVGLKDYIKHLHHYVKSGCLRDLKALSFYVDSTVNFQPDPSGIKWPKLATLEIVSTLKDIEYALTYAAEYIKTDCFPNIRTVCVLVKPNVPNLEVGVLGEDLSDMSDMRDTLPNHQGKAQNVQSHELDEKKFAEALFELKILGVEVHVWFSGDEQFTVKAGII